MSLSVFIPTYNSGHYIAETIESVLLQSIKLLKVIVVDNCSSDNTEEVVSQYLDKGVTYIKHPTNIGGINNHNFCLDIADTQYLKLLSADDVLLPNILALQLDALESNSNCGLVTCNYLITDADLKILAHSKILQGSMDGASAIKKCASQIQNLIGAPSMVMLARSAIGDNRFTSVNRWTSDLLFFCAILQESTFINIGVNGVLYRRHEQTDSAVNCTQSVRFLDEINFIQKFPNGKIEPHLRLLKRYGFKYINLLFQNSIINT